MLLSLYVSSDLRTGEKFVVKLGRVARLAGASETSARLYIRSLAEKGVIEVDGYGRSGYTVSLVAPRSVAGVVEAREGKEDGTDIETIDFFTRRQFVGALLERQGSTCFYSLRRLDAESCELDHLVPQGRGGDNSYRNVVCCSFEMNKQKGDLAADEFLRRLFRRGLLSDTELEERLDLLRRIQSGELRPAL